MWRSARLPCWKGRAGLGMNGEKMWAQHLLVTKLEHRVPALGDPICRNSQSAPVPRAGEGDGAVAGTCEPEQLGHYFWL